MQQYGHISRYVTQQIDIYLHTGYNYIQAHRSGKKLSLKPCTKLCKYVCIYNLDTSNLHMLYRICTIRHALDIQIAHIHWTTTWTEFCHFWPPLRGQFLYPERGQKQTFLTPPPTVLRFGVKVAVLQILKCLQICPKYMTYIFLILAIYATLLLKDVVFSLSFFY